MNRALLLTLSLILALGISYGEVNAATIPDPPSGFTATAVSSTQVNLFWNAPTNDGGSPITSYKIEYKIGSGSYTVLVSSTSSTYYFHTGLTTDQAYSYRIYAINGIGTSTASSEISATPTSSSTANYAGQPSSLSAVPVSPNQVNLFWNAPANNGGYPITGYKIEYREGSGSYTTLIADTTNAATTYSHTGLTTNHVYVYRVYAITSFGTSPNWSPEAVAQPLSSSSLNPPGAPTGLSAAAVSPTQVNLSWTAPTNNGGAVITSYKIEVKSGSGSYSTLSTTGNTATTYSHSGLTTGTTYTYRVSAINSAGPGTASIEVSVTPSSSSSSSTPGAPTGLTTTSISSSQVDLSWTTPTNNGGYQITGYKIEYKIGSGSYSTLVANTASTTTTYTHSGLSASQTYGYRVSAINSLGTGPASAELVINTSSGSSTASTPGSPSVTATAASPTQINLSWTIPSNGGSAITGYKIEVKKGTGSFELLVSNTQSTSTSFSHTGLITGTEYYYRVSAINSVGAGSAGEASAVPQETTTPTLTGYAISPNSIKLSWTAPSQTYKQSITGYRIAEEIGLNNFMTVVDNSGSTGTSYTINDVATGSTHTYVVSALFTSGASPPSNEISVTPTTDSAPPTSSQPTSSPPGSPTSLKASAISPTQIDLTWSPPSNTGGSVITGYKIDVKENTGSYVTLTSTQNATTKYSHAGLTTGTVYTYKIYAINSVGIGSPSGEASATPTAASVPPKPTIKPGSPTLSATLASSNKVTLSWKAPSNTGDSPITGYKIEYKLGSDSYRTLTSKATGSSYTHNGLLPNTYSYRIYAVNSAGSSPPSNEVTITTQEDQQTPEETQPEPAGCGTGTVMNADGVCVVDNNSQQQGTDNAPKTTHIPGFPDPDKDPQYYVDRYNSEPSYKEWFDRNFPNQSIYQVVGAPEPEPEPKPIVKCGEGTHIEDGLCVADENQQPLSGCLIATATFGTEMAPQVQQLREIREGTLLPTSSGKAFMLAFNDVYYAFSPTIADWERENPTFKELVKITITPMLSTLSILNYVDPDSEQELVVSGIGIIMINGGIYFGIPTALALFIRRRTQRT